MARIVIVGGGIVGLGTARAARRQGHEVILLERGALPNADGASFDEHRMIRPHYGAALGYARMVFEAFPVWEAVWRDLGARHFADSGAVAVSTQPGDYGDLTLATFRELGIAHEALRGAALAARFPHLDLPEESCGIVAHPAGPLYADRIVGGLIAWCAAEGVRLLPHSPVVLLDESGEVETASGERFRGDLVVVAAGAWLPRLQPERFGQLPTWRQAVCYVEAPPQHRAAWESAPAIVSVGAGSGYTLPPRDGTGLKFGTGAHRRRGAPEAGFGWDIAEGAQVLAAFPFLRDADQYVPLRLKVGYYVMVESRRFRLEQAGRCLFVTNCDGQMFKFGPLIGERIMAAFAGEMSVPALSRWAAGA